MRIVQCRIIPICKIGTKLRRNTNYYQESWVDEQKSWEVNVKLAFDPWSWRHLNRFSPMIFVGGRCQQTVFFVFFIGELLVVTHIWFLIPLCPKPYLAKCSELQRFRTHTPPLELGDNTLVSVFDRDETEPKRFWWLRFQSQNLSHGYCFFKSFQLKRSPTRIFLVLWKLMVWAWS